MVDDITMNEKCEGDNDGDDDDDSLLCYLKELKSRISLTISKALCNSSEYLQINILYWD